MRTFGWLLILGAIIALAAGLGMDTTVSTVGGARVHNFGLMRDQQNALMIGGLMLVVGLVLVVAARKQAQATAQPVSADDEKACPYCAEKIKAAAVVCRFCNRELPATPTGRATKTLPSFHATVEQLEELGIVYDGSMYHVGDAKYREFKDAERAATIRR